MLEEPDWSVVGEWAGCKWHSDSEMNMEMNAYDVACIQCLRTTRLPNLRLT